MAKNPKYFFNKSVQSDRFVKVSMFDMAVLLTNIWMANHDKDIGFEDADQTIDDLTTRLNHEAWLKLSDLESALWSCNLLDEKEKFWHPKSKRMDEFLLKLLGKRTFNKIYNLIDMEKPS